MSLIINKAELLRAAPIKGMASEKLTAHGLSYGLSEAGYDIRVKQKLKWDPVWNSWFVDDVCQNDGRFTLASSVEEFDMPCDMIGMVMDKSTWARKGISVFNTVIEPGWRGFLTLELVYHGRQMVEIEAGSPIAQVLFQNTLHSAQYNGKYQNQENQPVEARYETKSPVA